MIGRFSLGAYYVLPIVIGVVALVSAQPASAQINPLPTPPPKPGSFGIEATKPKPPPEIGARITIPGNGASFRQSPIRVSGLAPDGLLVQIYNNGVLVGSVISKNGSFSAQISLFVGRNDINAIVYDELDQPGPVSNTVRVQYTNTEFAAFGEEITLTSSYGRRSAAAGSVLTWPLQLSGGTGPYAFSIDWGDGSDPELKSQPVSGVVNISHIYKRAGIYQINIKVTDVNGVSAFLQLTAVANGKADTAATGKDEASGDQRVKKEIVWVPAAATLIFLPTTYWLGRRSQIVSLRNKMLKEQELAKKVSDIH